MIQAARQRIQTNVAALRAAMRRWLRPATLLLVVLCLALAEPLICIIHCQLAMPAQMHHDHSAMVHAHAPSSGARAQAGSTAFEPQTSPGVHTPWCFTNFSPANPAPGQFVPLSPVHELVLAATLALLPFLAVSWLEARPLAALHAYHIIPPTPPPRLQIFA